MRSVVRGHDSAPGGSHLLKEHCHEHNHWTWSMQAGLLNSYECIKAFSETDFTQDLKQFDVPTLVLHGEDDQIVPVKDSAMKSARLIKGAKDVYYPGAPHGITSTHQDQVNAELLRFLRSSPETSGRGDRMMAAA